VADSSPSLACFPASGSVFPVGTTTVTCTARDASGNTSTASFQITVKGASTQIEDLISLVQGLNLSNGLTNSLVNKLENSHASLDKGNTNAACNQLSSFVNEVEAKRGKELTDAQADQLVRDAARVRSVMGCT
jgi:arabinogalactan endo-1,4-beta-galactosidase